MSSSETDTTDAPGGGINAWIEQGVGWIELDNPNKLNAISADMWRALDAALAAFEADAAVRCVVFRGKGEKAFCAGADVAEKDQAARDAGPQRNQTAFDSLSKIEVFPKPTISMISGYCLGAGVALALACDLRIAAQGARFGVPAAKLGLGVHHAFVRRLALLIGPAWTKRMLFTADRLSAPQALQFGLVEEVVADSDLISTTRDIASRIASNAPLTIAAAKHAVAAVLNDPAERDLSSCLAREQACLDSEDYKEGRRAFLEKRPPRFQGR